VLDQLGTLRQMIFYPEVAIRTPLFLLLFIERVEHFLHRTKFRVGNTGKPLEQEKEGVMEWLIGLFHI